MVGELRFARAAVSCSIAEFASVWDAMPDPTPNPMNTSTFIRRRQGTWGEVREYHFTGQVSHGLGNIDNAPAAVRRCVEDARHRAGPKDAALYTGAHVNWYDGGGAWMDKHQDVATDERGAGLPIYSYTFLRGGLAYRDFAVYDCKTAKEAVATIPLRHGDMLAMAGDFQRHLWHSVPKQGSKRFASQQRLNVTVRPWGDMKVVTEKLPRR